jgi:acyl carrier protein
LRAPASLGQAAPPLNSGTLFAMTGARPQGEPGGRGALIRERRRLRNSFLIKDLPMSSTFDAVANIIAETCDIPRDTIKPESHAINDLGIDSLDFLDVAFAIDKAFGIKMPLEQWTQEVNEGKATTEQYFVLKNLCAHIDALVVAKGA